VPEDEPALVDVVARHLHGDAVAGQGLDPVLLHLAGRIGDDLVAAFELHPVAGIRQDLDDLAFKRNQFFLGHSHIPWLKNKKAAPEGRL
jgi:hypothetical protein